MKIAILTCADSMYKVFRPLMDAFKADGHECLFVSHSELTLSGMEHPMQSFRWDAFNLEPLNRFSPDRVIIFNGRFPWLRAASRYISEHFNTVFCELGWFPQGKHIYFSWGDIAENSQIAEQVKNIGREYSEQVWQSLTKRYHKVTPAGFDISRPYVVVPLQMESDTSIIYGSPYFKTMQSFIDWCSATCEGERLVFKTHPRCPEHQSLNFGRHEVVTGNLPLSDLISHSKAVVGINSTSLIESLVLQRPVVQLGLNIAMNDKWHTHENLSMGLAQAVRIARMRHYSDIQRAQACFLALQQVEIAKPQQWAIDNIINHQHIPRKHP